MKKKQILDPLWITKGSYLDSEYFNYVLLAASQKYRHDLEEGNLDYFYEIFFHSLNLNTLAVEGRLCNFKMQHVWKSDRIKEISTELKQIYTKKADVVEIFRNANYVFLNLMLDYMDIQLDVLDNVDFFYMNDYIHEQSEIFLVINSIGSTKYSVWKITMDNKKNFGYTFKRIKTINIPEVKENALREELDKLQDPELEGMKEHKNVCFTVLEGPPEKMVANVIKDTILLNKGIAKGIPFEPTIINEMHGLLVMERLMPFTLNKWID
ncbi:hypothetical protein UFOVP972_337 [uncultured Caudovirales phage]|uniref:Uncharacterized protein n=1 Tax=uncultured Caudovirales phage TaxID=2100421 RepID=A0A6J5PV13_9CAUD|nr:hypothetical protein UFOVP972_337 [uncultured Caudovirales phage]